MRSGFERIATVLDQGYLVEFHKLPQDLSFVFEFVNVTSVRATRWEQWPGQISELKGLPHEEQTRLVSEYQAKWREESDSWQPFEHRLTTGQIHAPDIYHAELARDHNRIALRVDVSTEDQGLQVITVPAENLIIRRSDGQILNIDGFLELGAEYWTAFASRRTGET